MYTYIYIYVCVCERECMCMCFFFFLGGGGGFVLINILVPQLGPQMKIPSSSPALPCYVYPWLWHYIYLAYEPTESKSQRFLSHKYQHLTSHSQEITCTD